MKNVANARFARLFAIVALAALIGFSFASCGDGGDTDGSETIYNPTGTWEFTVGGDAYTGSLAGGKWTASIGGEPESGTYSQNGNTLTLKNEDGLTIGTVTLTSNTTAALTLNQSTSSLAGTYNVTKRPPYILTGTWEFTVNETTYTVKLAGGTWTANIGGQPMSGKYIQNGNVLTLLMLQDGKEQVIGTTTFTSDTTATVTLNDNTGSYAGTHDGTKKPAKQLPAEDRWLAWRDPSSKASLSKFEVDGDGKVTITTGGTPEKQGVGNVWRAWTITAEYAYTSTANATYVYTIKAWKDGAGEREVNVQYYEDTINNVYLSESITLTSTEQEYTIYGRKLPRGGEPVRFQCAHSAIGTFYLQVVSTEEYDGGELTITNFRGTPGLRAGKWSTGGAGFNQDNEWVDIRFIQHDWGFEVPAKGDSITVNVFNLIVVDLPDGDGDTTWEKGTPFDGTVTITAGSLHIEQWGAPELFYVNKADITFTKGKATVNFGTQMKVDLPSAPGGGDNEIPGSWGPIDGTGPGKGIPGGGDYEIPSGEDNEIPSEWEPGNGTPSTDWPNTPGDGNSGTPSGGNEIPSDGNWGPGG